MVRKPNALDTSTLNYHWQMWDTSAFSIYANGTDQVDEVSAQRAVSAVLRFLTRMGILRYNSSGGYIATVLYEQDLMSVRSDAAGIYRWFQNPGDEVRRGDLLGEVLHSQEGTVLSRIQSPTDGILFFQLGRQFFDFRGRDGVQGAGGFVHQQDLRLDRQCAGNAQALLLAAGHTQCALCLLYTSRCV